MSQTIIQNFVTPMQAVLGLPKAPDPQAAIDCYMDALRGYSGDTLRAAAKAYLAHRKFDAWPRPGEAKEMCQRLSEAAAEHAPAEYDPQQDEWSDARSKEADDLLADTELGRQAVAGGWIVALWEWVRAERRLPQGSEIEAVMKKGEKALRLRVEARNSGFALVRSALKAMERREEDITARLNFLPRH